MDGELTLECVKQHIPCMSSPEGSDLGEDGVSGMRLVTTLFTFQCTLAMRQTRFHTANPSFLNHINTFFFFDSDI